MLNYVFRPIEKWPRALTPDYCRKGAPFKQASRREGETYKPSRRTPLSVTYDDLERELRHLGVKGDVVIQVALSERDIRQDGRPRANASRPSHPGVILAFTAKIEKRDTPLQFACDDCQQWEDNLRAIVKTLEHLRGADRYGVTKTGEQYRGWNALPPAIITPPKMNTEQAAQFIADQVGMGPSYARVVKDPSEFRTMYRDAANRWHPDRHQGVQHPEWNTLQEAKAVLDRHHSPRTTRKARRTT